MQRLFPEHHLRRQIELPPLWTLTTLDTGGLDHPVQTVVPCVWESIPGLRAYKGRAAYENTFEAGGTLRFVFQIRGAGTEQLSKFEVGDKMDILAPLGHGFTFDPNAHNLFIGGGIGVPPLFGAARLCGKNATVAVGFRNKDFVILEDDFRTAGCDLRIATDDGSYGHHGLVIDLIQDVHPDKIFACGPKVMLRAVTEFAKARNIPCEISLEERMACGIGACLGCAVELYDENGENPRYTCINV